MSSIRERYEELYRQRKAFMAEVSHVNSEIKSLQNSCPHENTMISPEFEIDQHPEDYIEYSPIFERRVTCQDCAYAWFEQRYEGEEWGERK